MNPRIPGLPEAAEQLSRFLRRTNRMKDLTWTAVVFIFPVHKCPQDATLYICSCAVFNRGTVQIVSCHTHLILLNSVLNLGKNLAEKV